MFITELQNQEVQDGYPVSFDCIVVGKPLPTVRWFKDGKALEENDHYMINEDQEGCHQLIITAVVPTDMGVYRCLAENNMGVASTKAELRVDCESQNHCRKAKGKGFCWEVDKYSFKKNTIYIKKMHCPQNVSLANFLGSVEFCQHQGKAQSEVLHISRGVLHNPGLCGSSSEKWTANHSNE